MATTREQFEKLKAIDIHVHAEVSYHDPEDPIFGEFADAATAYFKAPRRRPTIPETIAYYRERQIGFVMFTVDMEADTGIKRIRNEEIAQAATDNSDIMIAFASIDPHKGKLGALEARRLIEDHGVRGLKFHPPLQNFGPGGGGIRLKHGQPILVDDVAVDFPGMKIILAHPGRPWTDQSLSMALHEPVIFIDLSGWSPRYFPEQIVCYANGQLGHKSLFGSDFPLIPPHKWIAACDEAGFKPQVRDLILKDNVLKLLFGEATA